MKWGSGKINLDYNLILPSEDKYKEKYLIGIQLLLNHKSILLQSNDPSYFDFIARYEMIAQSTLLDFDRAYILFQTNKATKHLQGSTAECGVYKGGTSVLISSISPEKKHYAMDTYKGFPDVFTESDNVQKSFSDVSIDEIKEMFAAHKNIVMLKGNFSNSFKTIQDEVFSFVYIDADLYKSTLECCDFFYPRLLRTGIMLFDDYLSPTATGVKKAVDEFFSARVEYPIVLPTCQSIVFKL